MSGWFSTNILGNRDGLVLDEPANFHTKEVSKLSTLETILKPDVQPDLYGHGNDEDTQYYHKVRINYYPPRNDNKEGWDNIDIFGWMGYPMQIKINFLCRDSILASWIGLFISRNSNDIGTNFIKGLCTCYSLIVWIFNNESIIRVICKF